MTIKFTEAQQEILSSLVLYAMESAEKQAAAPYHFEFLVNSFMKQNSKVKPRAVHPMTQPLSSDNAKVWEWATKTAAAIPLGPSDFDVRERALQLAVAERDHSVSTVETAEAFYRFLRGES